jgi:hypothetical protein
MKQKLTLAMTILVLWGLLVSGPVVFVLAATTVDIDHEAGDLGEYDSTVTDGGDLSVTNGAALAGTNYGLSALIDDTTAIYGLKNISAPASQLRVRYYIDPNSLTMAVGDSFHQFYVDRPSSVRVMRASLNRGYSLSVSIYNDAGSLAWGSTAWAITDAPHYLEILLVRATTNVSANGYVSIWIDGVFKEMSTGVDNYDAVAAITNVKFGAVGGIDAGTSGTFYVDELIVNDDGGEIGPVVATPTPTNTSTATATATATITPTATSTGTLTATPTTTPTVTATATPDRTIVTYTVSSGNTFLVSRRVTAGEAIISAILAVMLIVLVFQTVHEYA